mgnify:FL=1
MERENPQKYAFVTVGQFGYFYDSLFSAFSVCRRSHVHRNAFEELCFYSKRRKEMGKPLNMVFRFYINFCGRIDNILEGLDYRFACCRRYFGNVRYFMRQPLRNKIVYFDCLHHMDSLYHRGLLIFGLLEPDHGYTGRYDGYV